jgi:hypothetical protein
METASQSSPLEGIVGRLRDCAQAYPEDVFLPTTPEQRAEHGTLITQAAAAMGRHFSPLFTEAADAIEQLMAVLADAPIVEVKNIGTDANGECRVFALSTPDELRKGPPLTYQRAKLVRWPPNA